MKTIPFLLAICSLSFIQWQSPQKILHPGDQNRFRIVDGDRVGFINTFGEVVIAPVFRNANTFSEGLCAARKNGLFGTFTVPRYEGDFKTRLRMELRYINPKRNPVEYARRSEDELVLYSPEFEGSINPGQFWRQNNYIPRSIMDPYNN